MFNRSILKRNEYVYTEGVLPVVPVSTFNYTYDTTHKNRLLSYNDELCSNYVLGNPNTYRGKTAVWTKVHRLASFNGVDFAYNYSGIRTSKTFDEITTKYAYDGETLIAEQKGDNLNSKLVYYYGFDGVTALNYGGENYFYQKNAFGDIVGIYNSSKQLVAKYVYDAWGNHKVITPDGTENTSADFIGNINPFRYRSYYFDVETGFYYLQSRYYDSQVGRFISMDQVEYLAPETINGLNLYAYCFNNPVTASDPTGTLPKWLEVTMKVVACVAVVAAVASVVVTGGASGALIGLGVAAGGLVGGIANEKQGGSFTAGFIGGAVNGFVQSVSTQILGPVGTVVGGGAGSGIGTNIMQSLDNYWGVKKRSPEEIKNNMESAAIASTFTSVFTAGVGSMSDAGVGRVVGGSIDTLGSVWTKIDSEIFEGFFSAIDDALSYWLTK